MNTRTIREFSASTLGDEPLDAPLPGGRGQVLQQHRADAAALLGVVDDEGDLGVGPLTDPVVPADPDQVVAQHRDQGDPPVVVDVGEPVQVAPR